MRLKSAFTFFAFMAFCLSQAQNPITLTTSNMPTVGFNAPVAVDTPHTSVNYGSAGANQVYSFNILSQTETQIAHYVALSHSQQLAFPNATIAVTSDSSTYIMARNSAAKWDAEGLQGIVFGLLTNAQFSPVEDIFHFTTQYQGTFNGSWGFYEAFTGAEVGESLVDSVRIVYTDKFSDVIDGWGKTVTPVGAYKSLREKRIDTTVTTYAYLVFGSWTDLSGYPHQEITTEYTYLAKETKGALVSFDYDSAGNVKAAKYSLIPPAAPIPFFVSTGGTAGLVTFTDSTDGYPTRWHWSFGDGDTSALKNPTHTYTQNGTYYVCETVYNAGGDSTYCDSVHVTGIITHDPPVANNDSATVHQPNSDTLNVTANDYSLSSDPFCITSVYGSAFFSADGCDSVIFHPTSNFTGKDTGYYIICNTGQPTLCDTAMIIVTVVPTGTHLPPVAVNDNVTVTQPDSASIDVTANDYSPSGDPFCITNVYGSSFFSVLNCDSLSYDPTPGFTGNDSAWYIICNTGQPTLCDTGMVIVNDNPNSALYPVVSFTYSLVDCGGGYFFNTSQNYTSTPMWDFHVISGSPLDSLMNGDTVRFYPFLYFGGEASTCLTLTNQYGSSSKCDTVNFICEGINEVQLSGINLYPNPASSTLTIDMRNNFNDITKDYTAIEIYNALGQKVISMARNGELKLVNIPVSALAEGLYLATIVDNKGVRSTLGKFTKSN